MIARTLAEVIQRLIVGYPIIAVLGPRQSGKTTLCKACFPHKPYINLEDLQVRAFAAEDPRGFLAQYPDGAIIDEAQNLPELFSYLQVAVDADGRMGLFVLTGSQQFGMHERISQSLAGRVAMLELLPFSVGELLAAAALPNDVDALLLKGSYPAVYDRPVAPQRWYADYFSTYIQRDVRQLINIQDVHAFGQFVRLCAGHVGQLINTNTLGEAIDKDHKTIKSWLSVLEASYLIFLLQPHHVNFKKRIIKTPKLYFHDVGLAAYLLGVHDVSQLATLPQRGALFENLVVSELCKGRLNRGLRSNLYFWRNSAGLEVDVIAEHGNTLRPIEIKSGKTAQPSQAHSLQKWLALAGKTAMAPTLIYGGNTAHQLHDIAVLPWQGLVNLQTNI